jgi:hypothetical protein
MAKTRIGFASVLTVLAALSGSTFLVSCSTWIDDMPKASFPKAEEPEKKMAAVNRLRDRPVTYVKLDEDILRPVKRAKEDPLPTDHVGPFELREESLAAALELVMGDRKIPMAFQTSAATTRTITMTNLEGPLDDVIDKVCGLADLYCSYEKGVLVIKDMESFTVSLPPFVTEDYGPFLEGLRSITGGQTSVDTVTNSLVYTATHRSHERAQDYFDRLRASTAMIVYEIQIWEVQLNDGNQTGIDWGQLTEGGLETIGNLGQFSFNSARDGVPNISGGIGTGIQFNSEDFSVDAMITFLQSQGAVKTVSQPTLTVLSGATAKLRVGNNQDYVSEITRTVGVSSADNVSIETEQLQTGLTLDIRSAWDSGTVYGDLKIGLQNLIELESLDVGGTSIQLPYTSDRALETKLRVRPGDSVIIGGIVEERDDLSQEGLPGYRGPLFTTYKEKNARNSELVFMLRPRVVVYTDELPTNAQLASGAAMVSEPKRDQNTPTDLSRDAVPVPVDAKSAKVDSSISETATVSTDAPVVLTPAPLPDEAPAEQPMSGYLDAMPADSIAPTL